MQKTFKEVPGSSLPMRFQVPRAVGVHGQRGHARLGRTVQRALCEPGRGFGRGRLLAPPFGEAKGGKSSIGR